MHLYTIGYQGRDVSEVIALLRQHEVEVLVDVRENPWSRRPEFRREALARAAVQGAGIIYEHWPALGSLRRIRQAYRRDGDWSRFEERFRAYLATRAETLDSLTALAEQYTVCLLCYERSPDRCHRRLVAEVAEAVRDLAVGELEVVHL